MAATGLALDGEEGEVFVPRKGKGVGGEGGVRRGHPLAIEHYPLGP